MSLASAVQVYFVLAVDTVLSAATVSSFMAERLAPVVPGMRNQYSSAAPDLMAMRYSPPSANAPSAVTSSYTSGAAAAVISNVALDAAPAANVVLMVRVSVKVSPSAVFTVIVASPL